MKFCTKSQVKQSKETSLLIRNKPMQRNCLHFKNTMRALRVSETKVTSGNALIVYIFALRGNKKSKFDKKTSFRAPR